MMHSASLAYQTSSLHYSYRNKGQHLLIAFHGYGETGQHFHYLADALPDIYRLVTIDMPYHGSTLWKEKEEFTAQLLIHLIEDICKRHGWESSPISVLGYSMGGRIALSLYQAWERPVQQMILLAPDGMKLNFWYGLATQTYLGNKLFAFTMLHPGVFQFSLRLALKAGLLNASLVKFVDHYMHDPKVRKMIYIRWTCLRKLKPDLKKIREKVRKEEMPVLQLYGRHDKIILPERGKKFNRRIAPFGVLKMLDCGHRLLDPRFLTELLAGLLHS